MFQGFIGFKKTSRKEKKEAKDKSLGFKQLEMQGFEKNRGRNRKPLWSRQLLE